jgi:hypothetical protein
LSWFSVENGAKPASNAFAERAHLNEILSEALVQSRQFALARIDNLDFGVVCIDALDKTRDVLSDWLTQEHDRSAGGAERLRYANLC